MINCPLCGKLTDPKLESCVHCGGPIQRPAAPQSRPQNPKRSAPSQTCPNCHALVQDGDISCVACGTNLLTGQKILNETPPPAAAPQESAGSKTWIIGLVIALIILAVIVFLVVLMSRDAVAHAEKLVAAGQTIQATDYLKAYVAKRPDNARAHYLLGKLQWQMDVVDGAAESFERAARLDPSNTDAAMNAALCYALQQDNASLAKAAALLEQLASRAPTFETYFLLAHLRGVQNDLQGQTEALARAVALEPNNTRAKTLLALCKALSGNTAGAIEDLSSSARGGATAEPMVAAARGLVYSLKGDLDTASRELATAADSGASLKNRALLHLSLLLIAQGKISEAQSRLEQILATDSANAQARFYRAVCLAQQRASREALAEFEALSRTEGPLAAEAAVQASRLYLQTNEPGLALEASDRAVQLNASGPVFYTIRGRILARNGQINEARDCFRNAIRSDATYAPAHLENALLFIQVGQVSEGIKELEAYLELVDPNLPDARVNEVRGLIQQLQQTQGATVQNQPTDQITTRSTGA